MRGGRRERGAATALRMMRGTRVLPEETAAPTPPYDLKKAKYAAIGEFVLPLDTEPAELREKLDARGVSARRHRAFELRRQSPATFDSKCSVLAVSTLAQAHVTSWFTVQELPLVARVRVWLATGR